MLRKGRKSPYFVKRMQKIYITQKAGSKSFESVAHFRYSVTIATNQNCVQPGLRECLLAFGRKQSVKKTKIKHAEL